MHVPGHPAVPIILVHFKSFQLSYQDKKNSLFLKYMVPYDIIHFLKSYLNSLRLKRYSDTSCKNSTVAEQAAKQMNRPFSEKLWGLHTIGKQDSPPL